MQKRLFEKPDFLVTFNKVYEFSTEQIDSEMNNTGRDEADSSADSSADDLDAGSSPSPEEAAIPERGDAGSSGGLPIPTQQPTEQVATAQKKNKKKDKKKDKKKGGGTVGSSRGIETMFRATYRVHMDLTALADSKANIMISINGLILSIILASVAPKIDSNNWLLIPTTVVLLSCLSAIIFAVLSARPRINASVISLDDVRSGRANILFFGNYSQLGQDAFVQGMTELATNPDLLYTNMMLDVYGIGRVLNKKFAMLRKSYMVFMWGLTVSVLAFIFVFVMQAFAIG